MCSPNLSACSIITRAWSNAAIVSAAAKPLRMIQSVRKSDLKLDLLAAQRRRCRQ